MTLNLQSTVKLNNGLPMPLLGLGTWRSDPGKVQAAVKHALKHGYRHIDAAHCYENQDEVGAGIKASGVPREEIFVTSKVWATHLKPGDCEELFQRILADLQLEYIDQLLIHWPIAFKKSEELHPQEDGKLALNPSVDLKDTWRVFEKFVEQGLCKSIGVSNCTEEQLKMFMDGAKVPPAVNQIEVQPYFNNQPLIAFCKSVGVHVVAYSPLGNFDASKDDLPSALSDYNIAQIAEKHSKSLAQVILRWHLQHGITAIPKSVTPARIEQNADIFDFELSSKEMDAIDALGARNFRICNPRYAPGGALVWPNDTTVF